MLSFRSEVYSLYTFTDFSDLARRFHAFRFRVRRISLVLVPVFPQDDSYFAMKSVATTC